MLPSVTIVAPTAFVSVPLSNCSVARFTTNAFVNSIVPLFVNPLATSNRMLALPNRIVEPTDVVIAPLIVLTVPAPVTSNNPWLSNGALIVAPDRISVVAGATVIPGPSNVVVPNRLRLVGAPVPNVVAIIVAAVLVSTSVPVPSVPPAKSNGPPVTVTV